MFDDDDDSISDQDDDQMLSDRASETSANYNARKHSGFTSMNAEKKNYIAMETPEGKSMNWMINQENMREFIEAISITQHIELEEF